MFKCFVVDGDTTDHGGSVSVPAAASKIRDRNIAVVGDKVHCPQCNLEATIIEGSASCNLAGFAVAQDGGLTSCGARLIAVMQDVFGFDEDISRMMDHGVTDRLASSSKNFSTHE